MKQDVCIGDDTKFAAPQSTNCIRKTKNTAKNDFYRDAYASRTVPWQDFCPSVCHMPVLSLNGYTYPQRFFLPSGRSTILVLLYQTGWQYSDGDPPNGGVECKGGMKNHDFRPISGFIYSYYGRRIGNRTQTFE